MKKFGWMGLASAVLLLFGSVAWAGGLYTNGFPQAGQVPNTLPLTGQELIPADTQLPGGLSPQTEAISTSQLAGAFAGQASYSANAATSSTTATAAQIAGNGGFVVLDMTGSLGAAGVLTTPTAAQIIAQLPNLMNGASYHLRVVNETAATNAWTLTAGSNVTVQGTATVAAASWTDFIVTLHQTLSPATVVFQRAGSGTK